MVASKYVPYFRDQHVLLLDVSEPSETRWRLGKKRLLTAFMIMGVVFLILSPTVLLPETWRQMGLLPAAIVWFMTGTNS